MADPTAPVPPTAPTRRETDELTPYDLHGPGRCWHIGCWERAEEDDRG